MKRHRSGCQAWKDRDADAIKRTRMEATSQARYGVSHAGQAPEVVARRQATTLERYGAVNPFSREASTFEKVKASMDGKRPILKGADNPFAREDVKAKIRATMTERYGVSNPQQATEIRDRTRATHVDRYGGELMGSPVHRAKIEATNLDRFGHIRPSKNREVKDRIRQTNMATYGVPWTSIDPDVRRRQLETVKARYGADYYFGSDQGKQEVRAALLERYGVEFPGAIEGHWEKAVAAFQERYGVDHPLQLEEFLTKRVQTVQERYGVDSPLQNADIKAAMIATKMERYGNPWGPSPAQGPNGLERNVGSLCPVLMFTGDFTFWRYLPKLQHHKNPDFIVPGPDPTNPKKGVTKVVEAFGDFWHSRMFTGRAPFDHEQEMVDAYADVGIQCLVLWEGEVKADPEGVRERLAGFCSRV